jgi:hypothetical protein
MHKLQFCNQIGGIAFLLLTPAVHSEHYSNRAQILGALEFIPAALAADRVEHALGNLVRRDVERRIDLPSSDCVLLQPHQTPAMAADRSRCANPTCGR